MVSQNMRKTFDFLKILESNCCWIRAEFEQSSSKNIQLNEFLSEDIITCSTFNIFSSILGIIWISFAILVCIFVIICFINFMATGDSVNHCLVNGIFDNFGFHFKAIHEKYTWTNYIVNRKGKGLQEECCSYTFVS